MGILAAIHQIRMVAEETYVSHQYRDFIDAKITLIQINNEKYQ